MNVCVIGLGYIGLPTAVTLARSGTKVIGMDVNDDVVEGVRRGQLHFVEPGLEAELRRVVDDGKLTVVTRMPQAGAYIIAVPTPFREGKLADLRHVEAATRSLAHALCGGELIILESTSPPGTTERLLEWICDERPDLDKETLDLAHCPERVLPGRMMQEIVENGRVIGGLTPRAAERAAELYGRFCRGPIALTTAPTAELVKLVENSYRDVNIAFANELSLITEQLGLDTWEVVRLANQHPRVNVLQPGPGVGGHCIAVDPWFIIEAAPDHSRLIRAAREVNDSKPAFVLEQVARAADASTRSIVVLGLAFKKNVDDLRGSPAVEIAESIAERYPAVALTIVEPHIRELPSGLAQPHVELGGLDALSDADVVVLLVDHDEFIAARTSVPDSARVIDTRGAWSSSA